jgi:hypothetical protein
MGFSLSFLSTKECEWADMSVYIAGALCGKVRKISHKKSQDKSLLKASSNEPLSVQRGQKDYSGQLTVLKGTLDDMNEAAQLAGYDDILDVATEIVIVYKKAGTRGRKTVTLVGVEFMEFEEGWEHTAKEMEINLSFIYLRQLAAAG